MPKRTVVRVMRAGCDIAPKAFPAEVTPEPPKRWWMESWTGELPDGPYPAVVLCDEPHRWGAERRYRQPERPDWPNKACTGVGNVEGWLRAVWEETGLTERPRKRKR